MTQKERIAATRQIIQERRSLYPAQYSEEPIDNEIVADILSQAQWAPMHKLTYPWRFVVFEGEGRRKLAQFQSELYKKISTAKGNFEEAKYQKLAQKPLQASHVIAIGMRRDPRESVPEVEEIAAVSCAVQNMYLMASSYGLGAYWGTGGVTYFPEAKSFFGLEAQDRLMGFFFLGRLRMDKWPQGKRKAMDDFVTWEDQAS